MDARNFFYYQHDLMERTKSGQCLSPRLKTDIFRFRIFERFLFRNFFFGNNKKLIVSLTSDLGQN